MPKKEAKVILITGATGRQGAAALRHLRERGFAVRALTRDPGKPEARALVGHGTEVVRGDLEDQASLTRALDGVYGVFSVQTRGNVGVEGEVRQGIGLADAAKRSRVSHFVYASVGAADQSTGIPHFESKFRIEEHLRGTGLRYTILRPVFFMENWLAMRPRMEAAGAMELPLTPGTRLQMVAVDDIGAFAALAFERPGNWQGRTMELAGDELSMEEIAASLSRVGGREIRYRQIPWEQFESQASPEHVHMYRWYQDQGFHVNIPAVRTQYPRLTGFEGWLQSRWAKTLTA